MSRASIPESGQIAEQNAPVVSAAWHLDNFEVLSEAAAPAFEDFWDPLCGQSAALTSAREVQP